MNPFLTNLRTSAKNSDLGADLRSLWALAKSQGPGAALRVALKGRRFAKHMRFGWHVAIEGETARAADWRLGEIMAIAEANGGAEVEDTVPKMLIADPFPRLRGILGPKGERWTAIHVALPHSRAPDFHARFEAWKAANKAEMEARKLDIGLMFFTAGPGITFTEMMMFWPDARTDYHDRVLGPKMAERIPRLTPDADARAFADRARSELIAVGAELGAAHVQIARTYPFRSTRAPEALAVLDAVKAAVDPENRMNPGVLGFPGPAPA